MVFVLPLIFPRCSPIKREPPFFDPELCVNIPAPSSVTAEASSEPERPVDEGLVVSAVLDAVLASSTPATTVTVKEEVMEVAPCVSPSEAGTDQEMTTEEQPVDSDPVPPAEMVDRPLTTVTVKEDEAFSPEIPMPVEQAYEMAEEPREASDAATVTSEVESTAEEEESVRISGNWRKVRI